MKKITVRVLSAVLALVALSALLAPSAFATGAVTANAAFRMETDSASVRAKDIVLLTITLTNESSKAINKLEFSLTYDETKILGITPDYATSINGIEYDNDKSPVVLRQQGSTIRVYNYDPSNSATQPTQLKAGQSLVLELPFVVSETATVGDIAFTISNAILSDISGGSLTADICEAAKVTILPVGGDASLSSLVVTVNNAPVDMIPAFSPDVTDYAVTVGYAIPSFGIAVTCSDDRASYSITERPKNDMLAVGSNVYKYLVTAEDGVTTKTYTLTIKRLAAGETTTTTESTSTTTTTETETTTTTTATVTTFSTSLTTTTTAATVSVAGTTVKEGSTVTLNMASLLGIVAAAVALFLLAFSAGYITHKNASQPQKYSVDELIAAQEKLELQNRLNNPTTEASYQPTYTPPLNSYQPTYTPPAITEPAAYQPEAAPAYQSDTYSVYQPEAVPQYQPDMYTYQPEPINTYAQQDYFAVDEFNPQQDYITQQDDSSDAYGLGSIDYAQSPDGVSTAPNAPPYYYQ